MSDFFSWIYCFFFQVNVWTTFCCIILRLEQKGFSISSHDFFIVPLLLELCSLRRFDRQRNEVTFSRLLQKYGEKKGEEKWNIRYPKICWKGVENQGNWPIVHSNRLKMVENGSKCSELDFRASFVFPSKYFIDNIYLM